MLALDRFLFTPRVFAAFAAPLLDDCFSTSSRTTYAAADIGLSAVIADAYMVSLLAEHDVHGRPLGGGADSETPSNPSHAARAHASRRENDKLAPLWYECPGLVQA